MYTIAKCRNCGEIKPSNMIGECCQFCGETLCEDSSIIDYDTIINNDNIFNLNPNLFYANYIPFEKFSSNSINDNTIELSDVMDDYRLTPLHIVVLFEKNEYDKEKFNGIIFHLKDNFYRIFINYSNTGNSENFKEVEIKEICIKNLNPSLLTKVFSIPISSSINEIPKLEGKYEKIYEKEILNHLNIKNFSKISEYISFNRVLYILRKFGIKFAETNESFLCNYDFFVSHPSITDTTQRLSAIYQGELDYSNTNLKLPLKNYVGFVFSRRESNNNYIDDNENFEENFIKNFLSSNKIEDYEDLFNYFDNFIGIVSDSFFVDKINVISSILDNHTFSTSQYAIYKICKFLGYKSSLFFNFIPENNNEEINHVSLFACIELEDDKCILLMNSKMLTTEYSSTAINTNGNKFYGINVFLNKENFKFFIDTVYKNNFKDKNIKFSSFEYKGNYALYKNMKLSEFLLNCINDDKNNYHNIIKESAEEDKFQDKRKRITEKIYKVFSILDKTGLNTKKYQQLFEGMTDDEFKRYMKNFLNDEDKNFYLECLPNKNEPSLKQIKSALEYLNVPLDEYVYYRHDGNKSNPIRTRYKVPVGYIHIKRLQQMLQKKNTYSMSIDKRSLKTNQVTGDDKIA